MRRSSVSLINAARAKKRGTNDRNDRLSAALEFGAIRMVEPLPVFELATRSFITGKINYLKIVKEVDTKSGKYAVYLNGERWRSGWSRTRFCAWLFKQISNVVDHSE